LPNTSYHHGDLKNALLKAAEQVLSENGFERFSLREVARVAKVSHSAPAHHFVDSRGLLTDLATLGFQRFLSVQKARQGQAGNNPVERRAAAGLGYIEFSETHPELFHLMFSSSIPDRNNQALQEASSAAFSNLVMLVNAVKGSDSTTSLEHISDIYAAWAMVHGLSSLSSAGLLPEFSGSKKHREVQIKALLLDNLSNK